MRPLLSSGVLLHDDPVALDFVEIKLDRCDRLGLLLVRRVDKAQQLTLRAQQHDAPAPAHSLGELGGAVFLAGSAGRHGENIAPALPRIESGIYPDPAQCCARCATKCQPPPLMRGLADHLCGVVTTSVKAPSGASPTFS